MPRRNHNVFHYFKRDGFSKHLHTFDYTTRRAMRVYGQFAPYVSKFFGR